MNALKTMQNSLVIQQTGARPGLVTRLLNDRLKIDTATIALNSPDNLVIRLNISYDLTNNLTLSAKFNGIFIGEPDMRYDRIKDYDRIDCVLEYHF